ncbi:nucleoside hydrolase [bacterium]|nr:nucleoside hydrolase [bacterium]
MKESILFLASSLFAVLPICAERINLWIDTDIGSDIDDALAISFAISRPEFNVVGISVVDEPNEKRLMILQWLLKQLGRDDIPLYRGWGKPILWGGGEGRGDASITYPREFEGEYKGGVHDNAPQGILQAIKKYDGNLVLLTIGAMTNAAIAYLSDPQTFKRLKKYVAMAGCFNKPFVEYNVSRDPYAAEVLLESGIKPIFVGLDVTMRCPLHREGQKKIKAKYPFLGELVDEFLQRAGWAGGTPILHDPLACAIILDESLVKKEERNLVVELEGGHTRGMMCGGIGEPNAFVCVDVDADRFVSLFVESLSK